MILKKNGSEGIAKLCIKSEKLLLDFNKDEGKIVSKESENKKRFFPIKQELKEGFKSVFGFKLLSVNKPAHIQEYSELRTAALTWHKSLMKTLLAYDTDTQINLKIFQINRSF